MLIEACTQNLGPSVSFVSGGDPIELRLNQNGHINDIVVQVMCGGDVLYEILAFNPPDTMFLSINNTSGELSLTVEAITLVPAITYRVSLRCYDPISNNQDITTLIVTRFDENEFSPSFDHGNIEIDIAENVSSIVNPTVVDINATDMDVGPLGVITYSIGAGGELFSIDAATGEIRLIADLDFENEQRYQFIVTAANQGAISRFSEILLVVNIVNIDDESPRFLEANYQPRLSETNSESSDLTVNVPLESQFVVSCEDSDTPSSLISYEIAPETDAGPFYVETSSGMFYVSSTLDYEVQTSYSFDVICFDNSATNHSDRVTVDVGILPVNEFVPQIEVDILGPIFIDETHPVGTLLATTDPSFSTSSFTKRYSYTDRDAGPDGNVTYSLGGDPQSISYLEIDLLSGNLTIGREVDFDTLGGIFTGTVAFISFTIIGCDTFPVPRDSNCPSIDVSIFIYAINEFTPTLAQTEYNVTVPESFPAGRIILSAAEVNCVDGDLGVGELVGVAFARPPPEILETFRIDSQNGEISTRISLDYEIRTSYGFELNCSDNEGRADRAIVHIEILPENDNNPMFLQARYSFDVSRTTPPNRFPIGIVVAIDSDIGLGGELTYTIQANGYFDIAEDGELLLFNSVQNYTESTITFEVFVSDGTNTDDSFVIIHLTEGNINRPVFQLGSRAILTSELSPIGTSIYGVFCNDTDSGVNGEIRYFFESGNTDNAFIIDGITGEITVNNLLVLPSNVSNQDYTLLVVCEDSGIPRFSDRAIIFVQVFQDDSSPPEIRNDTIIAFVNEDANLNTNVVVVEAIDLDSARLNFRFESQSVPGVFIIDPGTGQVSTAAALDRELINMYRMTVVVTEERDSPGPERSDRAELIIFVRDANDNSPSCNQSMLATSISEIFPLGEPIISLQCSDSDFGDNGDLNYIIRNNFGVLDVSTTGVISLQNTLNLTDRNILVVEVTVFDSGTPQSLSSSYQITIFIQSANSNMPEFVNLPAFIRVSEALPMQEIVFSVIAEDTDRGRFGQITYRLVNAEENTPFGIFSNTGRVFLTRKLNFFEQQMYTLNISADDSDFRVTEVLTIVVLDVNEYPPVCESYSITTTIREALPPLQLLSESVACSDEDEGPNGNLTYIIEPSSDNSDFGVFDDGSVLTLITLDFESQPHFELLLVVSDNGSPPMSVNVSYTVIVDPVNEFTPHFEQEYYTQSISEAALVGDSVISLTAIDGDSASHSHGQISYSLDGLNSAVFSISNTGLLRVAGNLDRELEDHYSFIVVASDRGTPPRSSEALVNITLMDIDDNPPEFTEHLYITTLNRTTEAGTLVSSVHCTDIDGGDNGAVVYTLDESSFDSTLFRIDNVTGHVFVNDVIPISRSYSFNVICTGPPPEYRSDVTVVSIQVIVNSNITFQLSEYRTSVSEDTMPVQNILTVSAVSSTGTALTYELLNEKSIFNIDRTTGILRLTSTLDFETTSVYFLSVVANDNGNPPNKAETLVQIDVINVNDERPQIESFPLNISLHEGPYNDSSAPVVVGQLNCSDADSGVFGQALFEIAGGNSDLVFRITAYGLLQLVGDLDYETRSSYSLEVTCEDGGTPPRNDSVTLPINILPVNDNSPTFRSTLMSISASEVLPIGSLVGDPITATDGDLPPHNSVVYSIIDGNTDPVTFSISTTSGQLTLTQSLDFEVLPAYTLIVLAEDSGGLLVPGYPTLNSTITIQINVEDFNDNSPTLSQRSYSGRVNENAGTGDEVILDSSVTCTDLDSGMNGMTTLHLMSDTFSIQTNGIIVVSRELNFEEQRIYFLSLTCQDNGEPPRSADALVDITVSDVNEFGPQFNDTLRYHFPVLESTPVGSIIGQVIAIDEDGGSTGTITYTFNNNSDSDYFSVDSTTGVIVLAIALDYETRRDIFSLVVLASDVLGNADIAAVTVETINEDDNTPVFTQTTYFYSVLENSPEGTSVGQVVCSDADDSSDGLSPTYALITVNVPFSINLATGIISSSGLLDLERVIYYTFEVLCFDSNNNNVSATVSIQLDPFNDFPPVFIGSPFSQSLLENSAIGTSVFQVEATDDDNVQYNSVSFRIVDGNMDNRFSIDTTNGFVLVSNTIDREVLDTYTLIIEAYNEILESDTSGSQPLSSTTTLTISITDQNDNTPSIIPENPGTVFISESDGPSTVVYVFMCMDPDFLGNGSTFFSITSLSETTRNSFNILENGTLITTTAIQTNVVVDVTCSDMGIPPRSTTVIIIVNTVSRNDHAPRFDDPVYTLYVDENQQLGIDIMCFSATDNDGPNSADGVIDYSLSILSSSDDPINRFAIRHDTGCVFVSIVLDITYRYYLYSITATDRGEPQMSSNASLMIFVRDVIRDPPSFVGGPYTRNIFETAEIRTDLVNLMCIDQDDNDTISYNITSGNVDNLFIIDHSSGVIRIGSTLDYETSQSHSLSVQCIDSFGLSATELVFITVTPINEFTPILVASHSTVVENSISLSFVTRLMWIDQDLGSDGEVVFEILSGNVADAFLITEGGDVLVRGSIDRETRDVYSLNVSITDQSQTESRSSTNLVNITVTDINDNRPLFQSDPYIFGPLEGTENLGHYVGTVGCSDSDTGSHTLIMYQYDSSDDRTSLFSIDSISGDIILFNDLAQRDSNNITFFVSCFNTGLVPLSDRTRVLVSIEEVNRFHPEFSEPLYYVDVPESTRIIQDTILSVRANDSDIGISGHVQYYLVDDLENRFFINEDTGDLSLLRSLDFEEKVNYTLIVEARDGTVNSLVRLTSSAEVIVVVTGVNEFTPECIDPVYVSIINETTQGVVLNFNCIDRDDGEDGLIEYLFRSGNEMNLFEVSRNGDLLIPSPITANEDNEQFELLIDVLDSGIQQRFTTIEVILIFSFENDFAPMFEISSFNFSASELLEVGSVIGVLNATDNDPSIQGRITYNLVDTSTFLVDLATGELFLSRALDWESESVHNFTVFAIDSDPYLPLSGSAMVTVIVINENDNRPHCDLQFYSVEVPSSALPNDSVVTLNCNDADGDTVRFSLAPESQNVFAINSNTGEIFVSSLLTPYQTIVLTVLVLGVENESIEVSVSIQVLFSNSDPPAFTQTMYTFSVLEDTPLLSTIGTLYATDPDSRVTDLTFRIEDPSLNPDFYVHSDTGEVILTIPLDFELQQQFSVGVIVEDAGSHDGSNQLTASATMLVNIVNTNDNAPMLVGGGIYGTTVNETTALGYTVLSIRCSDNDDPPFASPFINSTGFTNTPFRLVSKLNGEATVEVATLLSGSTAYFVNITCHDSAGLSDDGQIFIFVPEPSAPLFDQPIYEWFVFENEEVGVEYSNICATSDDNSPISYAITDGNPSGIFYINPDTGVVSLVTSLDYEAQRRHGLVVTAVDGANRQSSILLLVQVLDINDEVPITPPSALLSVDQNAPIGFPVGTLQCSDADVQIENGSITYNFTFIPSSENFSVDEYGVVRVESLLDDSPVYVLPVTCSESASPELVSTGVVTIEIQFVNQYQPQFDYDTYAFFVLEDVNPLQFVGTVQATDRDIGSFGEISYAISRGNPDKFFIEASSGRIGVLTALDRETEDSYVLTITAADGGISSLDSSRMVGTSIVTVSILDANDNPPIPDQLSYIESITTNHTVRTSVLQVQCRDPDLQGNGEVDYSLQPSDLSAFVIQSDGTILLAENQSNQGVFNFFAVCKDRGIPLQSSSALVTVTIDIVSASAPIFDQEEYNVTVSENVSISSTIIRVHATPSDTSIGIVYSIQSGNDGNSFHIDPLTGAVQVISPLDASTQQVYSITVRASTTGHSVLSSLAIIQVMVTDINNNRPVFSPSFYTARISELSNLLMPVVQIDCTDEDISAEISYYIISGNQNLPFDVTEEGVIIVVGEIDYENQTVYTLEITCTDGGDAPMFDTAELRIDILPLNEFVPLFSMPEYSFLAFENSFGTIIGQVLAIDDDTGFHGDVTYLLQDPGNVSVAFVDPLSGEIYIANNLDYEQQTFWNLTVIAQDGGGAESYSLLHIDVLNVNDVNPVIEPSTTVRSVPIESPGGFPIQSFSCIDADNVDTSITISSGNSMGYFQLNMNVLFWTGIASNLSSDVVVSLTITCQDNQNTTQYVNGYIAVLIQVSGSEPPMFTEDEYTTSVAEDSEVGAVVLTVSVTGPNPDLTTFDLLFSLPLHFPFQIHNISGNITLISSLDRELTSLYTFVVRATEYVTGAVGLTSVQVIVEDVNDNPPVITPILQAVTLQEDLAPSTGFIFFTCTDDDTGPNGEVDFSLIAGNTGHTFSINQNGLISLTQPLDFESIPTYNIIVQCRDGGGRLDTAVLTLAVTGVNEYSPEFENATYRFALVEDIPAGELVGVVNAFDLDNGEDGVISYSILSGMGAAYFIVNANGHIHKNIRPLNATLISEIRFTVRASDGSGRSGDSQVIIDIIDINEPPRFSSGGNYFIVVASNLTIGTVLFDFVCFDPDFENNALLSLQLHTVVSGLGIFLRTSVSEGVVMGTMITNSTLFAGSYEVTINCTDHGEPSLTSSTTVVIRVEGVNEAPVFLHHTQVIAVLEDEDVGTELAAVNATDHETDVTYQITGGDGRGTFAIDSVSGVISLAFSLDYEIAAIHQITVTAFDQSFINQQSASTVVNVIVVNINDNEPLLQPSGTILTTISEYAPHLHPVQTYTCNDPDGGNVMLTITPSHPESPFIISQTNSTAQISLQGSLDYDLQPSYGLTVTCLDLETRQGEGVSLQTSSLLFVSVRPLNMYPPEFNSSLTLSVAEDATIGQEIGNVEAFDRDGRAVISYTILSHTDVFVVDGSSGVISLVETLDRETNAVYVVTVVANDNDNIQGLIPLTSNASLSILVLDINDNSPSCLSNTLNVQLNAGSYEYEYLATLSCSDADEGENASLIYTFLESSLPQLSEGVFLLNETTGELGFQGIVTVPTSHVIVIIVSDSSDEPLTSSVNVVVQIVTTDTTRPRFNPNSFNVSVSENAQSPSVIFPGSTLLSSLINNIVGDSVRFVLRPDIKYSSIFIIDSTSGNVTLTDSRLLDYDGSPEDRQYTLLLDAIVGDNNATASILVSLLDYNDNAPQFTRAVYNGTVLENQMPGANVARVVANDVDSYENGFFLFSVVNSVGFIINSTTGEITTLRMFDREVNERYTFLVIATDMGSPPLTATSLVTVTIGDINDQPPFFSDSVYIIDIDNLSPPGTQLIKFKITDEDASGEYVFQIVSSDHDVQRLFTVDSPDGILRQRSVGIPDNHENRYNFTVEVNDGFGTDSTLVIIYVASATRDTIVLEENTPNQTYDARDFLLLQAFNVSDNANYTIEEGGDEFMISSNGILTTVNTLDREAASQYILRINVMDTTTGEDINLYVTINVMDQNDNAPTFSQNRYSFNISEGTYSIAQPLGYVFATDVDQPGTGASTVEYSIIGATMGQSDMFYVDPISGEFSVSEGSILDRETDSSHTLVVRARDFGEPKAKSSQSFVFISISDVNDNDPEFDPLDVIEYLLFVSESTPEFSNLTKFISILPGGILKDVMDIRFLDRDLTNNVRVTLRLQSGKPKYSLTRVSINSVILMNTHKLSKEDNGTVLEIMLRDEPEEVEENAVVKTITIIIGDRAPLPPEGIEPDPPGFFQTEAGIAVLVVICLVIIGLMFFLLILCCCCVRKIKQEKDPLRNA